MLFSNKSRFKENYLIAMVGNKVRNTYKRYEYNIYDELHEISVRNGTITQDDIQLSVRNLRELVASSVIETVDKEYHESISIAETVLKRYRSGNIDNINKYGPSVALVYSIVINMVMGEDYDFRIIKPAHIADPELEKAGFEQLAGVMLTKFEQLEAVAIRTSLEILMDEGLIDSYPEYE